MMCLALARRLSPTGASLAAHARRGVSTLQPVFCWQGQPQNGPLSSLRRRWLSTYPKVTPEMLMEELRAERAAKNLRVLALVLVAGGLTTVGGIWGEIKTAQIETWVARVYDTFELLDGVGKLAVATDDGGGDGAGNDAAQTAVTPVRAVGIAAAAVDVWKLLMSDAGVRGAGPVIPWDVVRGHALSAAVACDQVDFADILSELSDAAGPGANRDDFLAICGASPCSRRVGGLTCTHARKHIRIHVY
jgi:hypothetical protein